MYNTLTLISLIFSIFNPTAVFGIYNPYVNYGYSEGNTYSSSVSEGDNSILDNEAIELLNQFGNLLLQQTAGQDSNTLQYAQKSLYQQQQPQQNSYGFQSMQPSYSMQPQMMGYSQMMQGGYGQSQQQGGGGYGHSNQQMGGYGSQMMSGGYGHQQQQGGYGGGHQMRGGGGGYGQQSGGGYGQMMKQKEKVKKVYVPIVIRKRKEKKQKVLAVYKGFYIPGGTQIFGKFKSLNDCKKACGITPTCFAADFNPAIKKCFIHSNITACNNMRTHPKIIHFKKVPCNLLETPRGLITLGTNIFGGLEQRGIKNLQDCIKKCATAGSGIAATNTDIAQQTCFGIDYDFGTHKCYFHTNEALCPAVNPIPTPRGLSPLASGINILLCPFTSV